MISDTKKIDPKEVYRVICECACAPDDFNQSTRFVMAGSKVWGFHTEELERYQKQVRDWLGFLPWQFRCEQGGEFLDAGYQDNRIAWTANADRVEHLLLLGQAIGLVFPVAGAVDEDGIPMRYIVFV